MDDKRQKLNFLDALTETDLPKFQHIEQEITMQISFMERLIFLD